MNNPTAVVSIQRAGQTGSTSEESVSELESVPKTFRHVLREEKPDQHESNSGGSRQELELRDNPNGE